MIFGRNKLIQNTLEYGLHVCLYLKIITKQSAMVTLIPGVISHNMAQLPQSSSVRSIVEHNYTKRHTFITVYTGNSTRDSVIVDTAKRYDAGKPRTCRLLGDNSTSCIDKKPSCR